ncbi:exonuclease SbcCD subunit D [Cellulomonas pakistanensis]|uniref:Nuclease SbcCD subunit D n=1 Tax=Cellulomonas pakistanensis TaxID=992287 RepID=A0A919PEZ2_9CELL|nr:exonuclease SbcCD subunit D [Cellulomonas pakistanensis]GIG37669.1 nuclease SbcCD subunit D [Cellulomonas pakistanensis]
MRLLHTSDWHLGRTLHGVDLTAHQQAFLDHLVEVVRDERVDAVLVAGDVYDRAIPPVESVAQLSDALRRIAEHAAVVVTPGNHDSAIRLGFGADLMRDRVRVLARVEDLHRPVVLPADGHDVLVYGLPYLDPDAARHALTDPDADAPLPRSHAAVLGAAMGRVRADLAERSAAAAAQGRGAPRSVVLAHAFVVGGAASESERDIRVGGVDHAPAAVFDGVDYVALGHLHGPQRVGDGTGPTVLRYSGSPLAYSFSEARHAKSSVLVDLGPSGAPATTLVPAPVPRRLTDLTGPLEDLLGAAGEPHLDDWVRVTATDAHRPADLYRRVRARFPHALVVQHQPPARAAAPRVAEVTAARDPLEVAAEFVQHVSGARPTDAEAAVLRRAYEQVVAAERSA